MSPPLYDIDARLARLDRLERALLVLLHELQAFEARLPLMVAAAVENSRWVERCDRPDRPH